MVHGKDFLLAPVEVVGNEAHLLKQLILRIELYPSFVKFSGMSCSFPQSGQTKWIVGGSISLIR